MKKLKTTAFTLAEVLITLGIIGVVAAMTIPTLLANVNAGQYRSQLKKQISNLSQAGLVAQEQYGFDYATAETCRIFNTGDPNYFNPEENQNRCALIAGTQKGATYLGYGVQDLPTEYKNKWNPKNLTYYTFTSSTHLFQLADGAIVGFPQYMPEYGLNKGHCSVGIGETLNQKLQDSNWKNGCLGFIDVNGISKPNKETKCNDSRSNSSQYNLNNPCTVKSKDVKDIYPVVFHDTTVEPATAAGKYVLNSYK